MGTTRENGSLYTRIENRVAHLEFGHPAGNSFVSELLHRLAHEIKSLSDNKEVSIIVLRSEGDRAFCAGASLDELAAVKTPDEGTAFFGGFARVLNAMRNCSLPIIGRIQGKAVGGGVGLVAACDYVFATEASSLRLSELSIGIAPLVIAPAITRKAGISGLSELALSPTEWKSAYWAKEKGLFTKVYDSLGEMDKELAFFSEKLAGSSRLSLEALKLAMWENTGHWDQLLMQRAALTAKLALSPEAQHALQGFREK